MIKKIFREQIFTIIIISLLFDKIIAWFPFKESFCQPNGQEN